MHAYRHQKLWVWLESTHRFKYSLLISGSTIKKNRKSNVHNSRNLKITVICWLYLHIYSASMIKYFHDFLNWKWPQILIMKWISFFFRVRKKIIFNVIFIALRKVSCNSNINILWLFLYTTSELLVSIFSKSLTCMKSFHKWCVQLQTLKKSFFIFTYNFQFLFIFSLISLTLLAFIVKKRKRKFFS